MDFQKMKQFFTQEVDVAKWLNQPLTKAKPAKTNGKKPRQLKVGEKTLVGLAVAFFVFGASLSSLQGNFIFGKLQDLGQGINNYLESWSLSTIPWPSQQGTSVVQERPASSYKPQTSQEEAVIDVVKKSMPAVVSVLIIKEQPVYETYLENQPSFVNPFGLQIQNQFLKQKQVGTVKKQVGSGSGFVVSADGMVITNKHVVNDDTAEYKIVTNDGKRYDAKVLAKDPLQDLAVLQIVQKTGSNEKFPTLKMGDSDNIQIGQTAIAIGNALGEFENTVSVGVISGLGRSLTAEGNGVVETLEDIIQTDAAINKGNSGGPLLNLRGEVVGVNVAMSEEGQSIGFALAVNKAKKDIERVKNTGKIVYPFLGLRYTLITPDLQEEEKLPVDYGAWVAPPTDSKTPAIIKGGAAEKAGIKIGDIILEVDGKKITTTNSLAKMVQSHIPGDKITLTILRDSQTITTEVVLGDKSSEE